MTSVFHTILSLLFLIFSSSPISISAASETEALLRLKRSFTSSGALNNWVSGSDPCTNHWKGVICDEGDVTALHLSGFGLSGTIDIDSLKELHMLRSVSFVNNSFSGPIPEFNKLGKLKALFLTRNKFNGEIASDFFTPMSSLKKVWLSNNMFSGSMPASVMQLPNLLELHLEGNQFSGPIPPIRDPKHLTSFDISDNKLQGKIPEGYQIFKAPSFSGNAGLCGKPLDRICTNNTQPISDESPRETIDSPSSSPSGSHKTKYVIGVASLAALAFFIIFTFFASKGRHKDENFTKLEKENLPEVVPSIKRRESSKKPSESSRKEESTKRGVGHNRSSMNDLVMVNEEKGKFGMSDLMKAAAEVLGNGGLGSSYKAVLSVGLAVVVKRMREMNTLGRDVFDAEMRQFGRLRHKNILTPSAYHFRKEEKLLISEYIPKGSLLYVLHGDRGSCHANLNWETRLKIIKGIASGLGFLHTQYSTYTLPHGNLKSSNILLTDYYEPLLNDYSLDPLTNPNHAAQAMFAYRSPEYIQYHQVSPKSDVYCFGIIILEIITGKFPSQYLTNGKGGTDVVNWVTEACYENKEHEVIDPEIASDSNSLELMVRLLQIGAACAESDPTQRLDLREAIRNIEEMHA